MTKLLWILNMAPLTGKYKRELPSVNVHFRNVFDVINVKYTYIHDLVCWAIYIDLWYIYYVYVRICVCVTYKVSFVTRCSIAPANLIAI